MQPSRDKKRRESDTIHGLLRRPNQVPGQRVRLSAVLAICRRKETEREGRREGCKERKKEEGRDVSRERRKKRMM